MRCFSTQGESRRSSTAGNTLTTYKYLTQPHNERSKLWPNLKLCCCSHLRARTVMSTRSTPVSRCSGSIEKYLSGAWTGSWRANPLLYSTCTQNPHPYHTRGMNRRSNDLPSRVMFASGTIETKCRDASAPISLSALIRRQPNRASTSSDSSHPLSSWEHIMLPLRSLKSAKSLTSRAVVQQDSVELRDMITLTRLSYSLPADPMSESNQTKKKRS